MHQISDEKSQTFPAASFSNIFICGLSWVYVIISRTLLESGLLAGQNAACD